MQDRDVLATLEAPFFEIAAKMVAADVVGPPLEKRHPRSYPQGLTHAGQIPAKQLVLKGPGPGAHQHHRAGEQRGHQIAKGFADAGSRLRQQQVRPVLALAGGKGVGGLAGIGALPRARFRARACQLRKAGDDFLLAQLDRKSTRLNSSHT